MLAYDEQGNLVEDGGQQYNPDPLATNNPQYGDPFNRFMNSPHMAGAQQALINMQALRRGQVSPTTPFSAMYDVRKQNQLLMDRKFAYLEEKQRWKEGQALRDAQLKAANFTNQTNASAVPNPYQNLPQDIQEWTLSGAKDRGVPFEKFMESKNPFNVQPTQPTSVMQNFGMWRQLNPPAQGETQEQYLTRAQGAFNNLARAGVMVDYGGGGLGYVNPLTGTAPTTVVTPESATALEATQAGAEQTAKDTAAAEVAKQTSAPADIATGEQLISLIDMAIAHPGRETATGKSSITNEYAIPGTERADYLTLAEQLKGNAFLQAYQSLKGAGSITEQEGKAATAAQSRLNESQTEGSYLQALEEMKRLTAERLARVPGYGEDLGSTDGY